MIELYRPKIFAGKYDSEITEWITGKCIERQYNTRYHRFALQQSHTGVFIMIFVNLVFLTELSRYGIVYQIT